ncbi:MULTISPECIES: PxKF domain-containing protein [Nocardioides]|uniref:PxKF domain-containing protein n=1 Tax=Nocardioides vastitatis TaxID=2568655 RepID=A0ABW0ZKR3_9ACTN|nr:PxKF domain-containing protein [Nocardioides sp.]THJ08158.1 hypothetical protein E7Z54_04970 [Nocardioides sp.]
MRTLRITAIAAGVSVALAGGMGIAHADNIQDTIADVGAGVTLVAGSPTAGNAAIRLIGNSSGGDVDPNCNIDPGEAPLRLDIVTPAGVTANPDPLEITGCGTEFPVSFTASSTAESGTVTVAILSGPAGNGSYKNEVSIPITVTQPVPSNTKPTVAVTGVLDGATYEIGAVPSAACQVTDTEDGNGTTAAVISGTLSHGLGQQTATCDYTDAGGLHADTATAVYTIVDTGAPTISHSLSPSGGPNANGWYKQGVTVTFDCSDSGSGIASCLADGESGTSKVLSEGANQSVTGTATDWAGNTATDTASGINIDTTAPSVALSGGPAAGGSYYYGSAPAAPTCIASDALSGLDGSCVVSGGGTAVGTHSYTATATDLAGNENSATSSYSVLPWDLRGFYSPVNTGGVWNTVKGGATVPLKFEVFAASELTSTTAITGFTVKGVACPGASAPTDDVEFVTTGGTSLRYDSTAGQFIQNWQTPKRAGACYAVTMTTQDGSSLTANFLLK